MKSQPMKRRNWIKTALAVPGLVALPAAAQQPRDEFAKVETVPAADRAGEPVPMFFSKAEYAALEKLAVAIMPSVDGKPGALQAGVPAFLDFHVSQSPTGRQQLYRDGLARFGAGAGLGPLSEPWTHEPSSDPYKRFLREAKIDIVQATFNSREWIEARPGGRGGAGTYYLAVE